MVLRYILKVTSFPQSSFNYKTFTPPPKKIQKSQSSYRAPCGEVGDCLVEYSIWLAIGNFRAEGRGSHWKKPLHEEGVGTGCLVQRPEVRGKPRVL